MLFPRTRPAVVALLLAVVIAVGLGGCTSAPSGDASSSAPSRSVADVPSSAGRTTAATTGSAGVVLASLPVKGRAPQTGYSREEFGPAWTDDNDTAFGHNGCDTRNDVLRRDLGEDVLRPGTSGCVLLSGVLHDPYTATTIDFRRGEDTSAAVQIDHVVALSNAWQTGAQQLSPARRRDLANDPLELLAVDGPTNQAKGDGDAATWLPPNKPYRCSYVARQIAVKHAYGLWVTPGERDAMSRVLGSCPGQNVPRPATSSAPARPSTPVRPPTPARSSTPVRSPTPVPSSPTAGTVGCTTTPSGNCIRGGQFCKQAAYGNTGTDADDTRYVCRGDRDRPRWEQ